MCSSDLARASAAVSGSAASDVAPSRRWSLADGALQRSLGVWTTLVLVFLFIPVGLVFLHSFNRGNSFTIFSNAVSTKWWGELFDAPVFLATAGRFAVFIVAAVIARRLLARRALFGRAAYTVWLVPGAFALALVINGLITSWYATLFDFAGIGDAIRNSFIAAFGATVIAVALGGTSGVALAQIGRAHV